MNGHCEKITIKKAESKVDGCLKLSNWKYVLAKWEGLKYPMSRKSRDGKYEKAQIVKSQNYFFDEMDALTGEMGVQLQDKKANVSICSLNVNGLDDMKIDSILWFAVKTKKDLFFMNDTRLLARESKRMEGVIKGKLGLITTERWIVILNPAGPEDAKKNQRVGGCIWLMRGPLIPFFKGIVKDKTGLGIVTALKFIMEGHPVLAVGAYWAVKPREETCGLWGKVLSVLKRDGLRGSPLTYVQDLVSRLVQEHAMRYGGVSTEILVGDLNTNRKNEVGGSHPGIEEWLEGTGVSDEIGNDDCMRGSVLKTFWHGETEVSRIDHILINSGSMSQIVEYGVSKSAMWVGITDHRPIWANILIDTKAKFHQRVARVYEQPTNMQKLVKLNDRSRYQQDMSMFVTTLSQPETLTQASYQLETIYLKSVAVMKSIFPKNTLKNLGQNWSAPTMALKKQLLFLTLVRRVVVNCKINNRSMRRHIKHHVVKWSRAVAKLIFENDD